MFRPGDRVEALDNVRDYVDSLTPGVVYTVGPRGEEAGCVWVTDDNGKPQGPYAWRFRFVEEDPKGDPRTGTNAVSRGDQVNSPSHYVTPGYAFEVIDAIEAWGLNYRCGAVVKYVARHLRKGKPLQDLRKAKWYLEREIAKREAAGEE